MTNPAMLRLLAELRAQRRPLSRASLCLDCQIEDADFDAVMAAAREHLAIDDLDRIVTTAGGRDAGSRYQIESVPRPDEVADGSGWSGAKFGDIPEGDSFPRCVPAVDASAYPSKPPTRPYTATGGARAAEVVLSMSQAIGEAETAREGRTDESWQGGWDAADRHWAKAINDALDHANAPKGTNEGVLNWAERIGWLADTNICLRIWDMLTELGVPKANSDGGSINICGRIEWLSDRAKDADEARAKLDTAVNDIWAGVGKMLDRYGVKRCDSQGLQLSVEERIEWLADQLKEAENERWVTRDSIQRNLDDLGVPHFVSGASVNTAGTRSVWGSRLQWLSDQLKTARDESRFRLLLRAGHDADFPDECINEARQIQALLNLVETTGARRAGDGWELDNEKVVRSYNHGWLRAIDELNGLIKDAGLWDCDPIRLSSPNDKIRNMIAMLKAARDDAACWKARASGATAMGEDGWRFEQGAGEYPALKSDPQHEALLRSIENVEAQGCADAEAIGILRAELNEVGDSMDVVREAVRRLRGAHKEVGKLRRRLDRAEGIIDAAVAFVRRFGRDQ